MYGKLLLAVSLFMLVLLTGGCWDRKEIENRGYVLGAAIDRASPGPKGQYDLDKAFQQAGERKYRLSYELRKFRAASGGSEKAGEGNEENMVYSAEGESLFAATRAMNSEAYFGMFLEDMQVVLINEAVAREGVMEIFDFFARDPEMRRRAKIYVTHGKAEDFFKLKPKVGEITSFNLAKLATNVSKTPTYAATSEFGYVSEALHSERGFAIPILYLEEKNVKAAGAALFNRKGKMVGTMGEYEPVGGKIWRKKLEQGLVVVPNPDNPEKVVVFELFEAKITIKPEFQQDTVRFVVEGEFSGNIAEKVPLTEKAVSTELLNKIARAVAAEYTKHTYAALKKMQMAKADAVELGDHIRRKNPQYWNTIKDCWEEEIFPMIEADVKISVTIKGTGMLR